MFTPIQTTVGALLLSASTTSYLLLNGKILGISGVLGSCILSPSHSLSTSIPVVLGILSSVPIVKLWLPDYLPNYLVEGGSKPFGNGWTEFVAGVLVGFGTKIGSGCTSGHMLCGLPRLSIRSVVSTATFFASASLTTNLLSTFPLTSDGVPPITLSPTPALLPLAYTLTIPLLALLSLRLLPPNSKAAQSLTSAIVGTVFGLGLLISGMASPSKVLSFLSLRITSFDPSLACVVLFGIVPNALLWWFGSRRISSALRACACPAQPLNPTKNGYQSIPQANEAPSSPTAVETKTKQEADLSCPVLCEKFDIPTKTEVDAQLVGGSAVFGLGWGLAGICPGPGILGVALNGVNGALWMLGFALGRGSAEVWSRMGKKEGRK